MGSSIELASCLLDSGADVNYSADPAETSPLVMAAAKDYEKMLRLLLDRGANIEFVDQVGKDAIALAKEKGHKSVVRILQTHRSIMKASKNGQCSKS